MPWDRSKYPEFWEQVVNRVRQRSGGRCECTGQCGLHKSAGPRRCEEVDGEKAIWAKGRVLLTTAHLDYPGGPCDCEKTTGKKCGNLGHLIHCCQRCHLRIDGPRHVAKAKRNRKEKRLKKEPGLPGLEP